MSASLHSYIFVRFQSNSRMVCFMQDKKFVIDKKYMVRFDFKVIVFISL